MPTTILGFTNTENRLVFVHVFNIMSMCLCTMATTHDSKHSIQNTFAVLVQVGIQEWEADSVPKIPKWCNDALEAFHNKYCKG